MLSLGEQSQWEILVTTGYTQCIERGKKKKRMRLKLQGDLQTYVAPGGVGEYSLVIYKCVPSEHCFYYLMYHWM